MFIQQLYTGCLSEAAYYIESEGRAAIIDPIRDTEQYIRLAADRQASIQYIFETHFHADFVSGHIDLGDQTGAPIVYGPGNNAAFPVITAADGQFFDLGKIRIQAVHTPGHTMESVCYVLWDESGKVHAVFTGDTLFVGDVGRPDLAQKGETLTVTDLAGKLFDSLHDKILNLPDDTILYPGHGAGSSCGKNIGAEKSSTIANEKLYNYALRAADKDEFIRAVTEGLNVPPVYFPVNATINKTGYQALDTLLQKALQPLSVAEFEKKSQEENTVIIDTRDENSFTQSFIPGAVFIGLNGRFAEWAGQLVPFDHNILLVTAPGQEQEAVTRLARVGFEKIVGYLDGGFAAWQQAGKPIDLIVNVGADEVAMDYKFDNEIIIVDVRKEAEYDSEHIKNAVNIPLETLTDPAASLSDVEDNFNMYLHCAGGYRSVVAASLMKREGFHNLHNILGGYNSLREIDSLPKERTKAALN